MNKNYISLKMWTEYKQVLLIWYTKDWWFFIKDLIRKNQKEKTCTIIKIGSNVNNNWIRKAKPTYIAYTSWEAKFTHHYDWNAHISWAWVLSWYNQDGTPKWAHVKSFSLETSNDWGPIFWFSLRDKNNTLRNNKEWDILLEPNIEFVHDIFKEETVFNTYVIKWFYIPRSMIKHEKIPKKIYFMSPIEWLLILNTIKPPINSKWVLWIYSTFLNTGMAEDHDVWFSLSAWPWKIYNNICESLCIMYPKNHQDDKSINLDYNI